MKHGYFFDRPSDAYEEALPLGNGKLGAMVSGAVQERLIWLNEETCWYGGPRDRINPDAAAHIGKIKELVAQGNIAQAEQLALLTLTGVPESQRHFTTMGMVALNFFDHDGTLTGYRHSLDFQTATTTMEYMLDGVTYCMQVHANAPESVIVVHVQADKPVLHFYAGIERGERVGQFSYGTHEDDMLRHPENGVIMSGSCGGKNGLEFAGALFAQSNGSLTLLGDKLVIENADQATLYISLATSFATKQPLPELVAAQAMSARAKGYDACLRSHLQEWRGQYQQTDICLQSAQSVIAPSMNELFAAFESNDYSSLACISQGTSMEALHDYLTTLLFRFGRYCLLSASRYGELPAPLQGLWCRDLLPAWDGKYTTNINLQMAYWPADAANMSQCYEPLIHFALRIRESGMVTARRMYNCRGFVMHNNTDIWADTAVQDAGTHCSYWFVGGVWLAIDLYEHFRYTRDREMLRRIWPVMRDAALFMLDFMDEVDGKRILGVTTAPENFYFDEQGRKVSFCQMCAMDAQLVALLFAHCRQAAQYLREAFGICEAEDGFFNELELAAQQIELPKIGLDGTILEWGFEAREAEPQHRHMSHLVGVYPYNFITEHTPELLRATQASLEKRIRNGGCNTGWGRAWGAGMLARFGRGNEARNMVGTMLQLSGQPNLFSCCNCGRVPKLLENSKPMQLDGTMGTVQAVIEMLLQSHCDAELRILPALPDSWDEGSFAGLRARGNLRVDAQWRSGKLLQATVMAGENAEFTIFCNTDFTVLADGVQISSARKQAVVSMQGGHTYLIQAVQSSTTA